MSSNEDQAINALEHVSPPLGADGNQSRSVRLVNIPSGVPFFKGTVDGEMVFPTAKTWFWALETLYFDTMSISDDSTKLKEAKRFLDKEQGSAYDCINSREYSAINTWDGFKEHVLEDFKPIAEMQPLEGMKRLHELEWSNGEHFLSFLPQVERLMSETAIGFETQSGTTLDSTACTFIKLGVLYRNMDRLQALDFQAMYDFNKSISENIYRLRCKYGEVRPARRNKSFVQNA